MPYQFLSDEWVDAARKIREDAGAAGRRAAARQDEPRHHRRPVRRGHVDAHMDTTSGAVELDLGHLDGADVTATLDYETAKAMMVDANPQAAMQAFMAGKIKLQGDMTKAMALQSGPADPELTKKIQEITA